jgi:hypothetical protein
VRLLFFLLDSLKMTFQTIPVRNWLLVEFRSIESTGWSSSIGILGIIVIFPDQVATILADRFPMDDGGSKQHLEQ